MAKAMPEIANIALATGRVSLIDLLRGYLAFGRYQALLFG
jgi:hypothetical protein